VPLFYAVWRIKIWANDEQIRWSRFISGLHYLQRNYDTMTMTMTTTPLWYLPRKFQKMENVNQSLRRSLCSNLQVHPLFVTITLADITIDNDAFSQPTLKPSIPTKCLCSSNKRWWWSSSSLLWNKSANNKQWHPCILMTALISFVLHFWRLYQLFGVRATTAGCFNL